jgi:hypothetical protein
MTFQARWHMATEICSKAQIGDDVKVSGKPDVLVERAARFWHTPLSRTTRQSLERYAAGALRAADADWERETYPRLTENALRMLVAVSPDYLTS